MEKFNEPLYKAGDFRKAIEATHNYVPKTEEEIKIPYELLKGLSVEEKFKVLEKMVKSNSLL